MRTPAIRYSAPNRASADAELYGENEACVLGEHVELFDVIQQFGAMLLLEHPAHVDDDAIAIETHARR